MKIYILTDGRKQYLEFLRNLTPQILIITMLIISGSKLDWSHISFSNAVGNFLFWGLLAIFITAAWANSAEFLATALNDIEKRKKNLDPNFKNMTLYEKIKYASNHHMRLLLEIVVTMVIIELGLASVIIVGIGNGQNFLRLLSHST
ncbi:hypothetical protein [Herbaspirillum autotrophicum]|uniref:hypothetical protein n=1 Tax=Herbaspirillum autotrophicum TaxID=180195 RepID=UPI00067AFBC7|nr:hypothetical protein [Herbaspirillum autotrophicum]